ncbi:MAG: toast rack family protein [Anaerolineaceae bacterium]
MKRPLILVLIVLMLSTLACTININVPEMKTIPTQEMKVDEALPTEGGAANINLKMGAGSLNLVGGANGLVTGSIEYNVEGWKPELSRTGNTVSITQTSTKSIDGIPSDKITNRWDLALNSSTPINLDIEAGAYSGKLDLSGLRLQDLDISDGASESKVMFNIPNPEKMARLVYKTGASKVDLIGLGNANFTEMRFEGGAGTYTLDFTGALQQEGHVEVQVGVCNLTIRIPEGMNARVNNQGALTNINTQGTWSVIDNSYEASGSGPLLEIDLEMGLGNLNLIRE